MPSIPCRLADLQLDDHLWAASPFSLRVSHYAWRPSHVYVCTWRVGRFSSLAIFPGCYWVWWPGKMFVHGVFTDDMSVVEVFATRSTGNQAVNIRGKWGIRTNSEQLWSDDSKPSLLLRRHGYFFALWTPVNQAIKIFRRERSSDQAPVENLDPGCSAAA